MTRIQGIYFDGRSARKHAVTLELADGLNINGAAGPVRYAARQASMGEPFAHAPCVIDFDDGARVEIADLGAYPALKAALGYRVSRVERWQQNALAAAAAVVLMGVLVAAGVRWGVPALAERIVPTLPASVDRQLGDTTFAKLKEQRIEPSRLSARRVAELQALFRQVAPAASRMPLRFHVVSAPQFGPNAFALPNGDILMTDAMVRLVLDGAKELDQHMLMQLAGVMAHEIGHVQGRHSIRALTRGSLMALSSAALFGDFSSVAATVPALLLSLDYSRDMEREADRYAIVRLRALGMSAAPLGDLFAALEEDAPASELPRWLDPTRPYLSSHPGNAERIARFRQADPGP